MGTHISSDARTSDRFFTSAALSSPADPYVISLSAIDTSYLQLDPLAVNSELFGRDD